ncbi:MAG: hypothetical protein ACO1NX_08350 [Chitinophagaceae bacterium]
MRLLLGIIILLSSCENKQVVFPPSEEESIEEPLHSPAVNYPSVDYDEVALYSVSAKHYKDKALNPLNGKKNEESTVGFAILDSLGNPVFQNIDRIILSPLERSELQSIFHLPENKGEISKNMCIAFFRDAFVFYKDKNQVAQAQICFDCNQVYFSMDTAYLSERFNTDGDWNRLQKFVSGVKAQ